MNGAILTVTALTLAIMVSVAIPQAPAPKKGPPPFQLGRVLPPPLRQQLDLTAEQERGLDAIEKEVRERLERLLTAEQKRQVENFRPFGPPASPDASVNPRPTTDSLLPPGPRFIVGGSLRLSAPTSGPTYEVDGAASEGELGDLRQEYSGRGIRLKSSRPAGSVAWMVNGLPPEGRWFRFRIRGMAQDNFRVDRDELFLRVDFLKDGGTNPLDGIKQTIYEQVQNERQRLADAGMNRNLGSAKWRNYGFEFRTPFAEVDTLRLSVGFAHGAGKGAGDEFWVNEVEITPIADPVDYVPAPLPPGKSAEAPRALKSLVSLGGRWYYDPRGGSKDPPRLFDHSNVDRLFYFAGRLEAPFAGNTSAWLRKGYLDAAGQSVEKDRFITDNVVLSFTGTYLVMKSHNLPNHPTAVFPDRWRLLDGNPNYLQEQINTWHIPLEPKVNPRHIAMDEKNTNKALKLGPIGVAVNGVVFLNPFDESNDHDALWRLDRCCGHPSPGQRYHYHKYPVCLNTPWLDDGRAHSPLIGFAFDGFPVYGPYEAAGELAKDATKNPLNEFNVHRDDERGWHYNVTPGKFPHIIGGYWGNLDERNREQKGSLPFKKKAKA